MAIGAALRVLQLVCCRIYGRRKEDLVRKHCVYKFSLKRIAIGTNTLRSTSWFKPAVRMTVSIAINLAMTC